MNFRKSVFCATASAMALAVWALGVTAQEYHDAEGATHHQSGHNGSDQAEQSDQTLLLQQPTASKDKLAFVYAGDIYVSGHHGENPRRLTTSPANESRPFFSPDGSQIAFTADYQGNTDVYVISADGGVPKRLTYHPGGDEVQGWSPDGQVMFTSRRERTVARAPHLYHISPEGGAAEKQMQATLFAGSYSPDGKTLAYLPFGPAYNGLYGGTSGWKLYRGGRQPYINLYDLKADTVTTIDKAGANNLNPVWSGGKVYFLSDRDGKALNLFEYDPDGGKIRQITRESDWDVRWLTAAPSGHLIYEVGGGLMHYKPDTEETEEIRVKLQPDLPQLRPRWEDASRTLQSYEISPTGKRVLLTARGEVFSVPTGKGSTRNITRTDGVREMTALWSPKGDKIAYLSDKDGVTSLMVEDQDGFGEPRQYELTGDLRYFFLRAWTPDGKHLLIEDNRKYLHSLALDSGEIETIARNPRRQGFAVAISPDSRYLAYDRIRPNFNRDIVVRDLRSGEEAVLTDGMADATDPAFSPDGKYLYFAASTNAGPRQVGLDMSSQERPLRKALYAVVLKADGQSPLLPEAGDEPVNGEAEDTDAEEERDDRDESETEPHAQAEAEADPESEIEGAADQGAPAEADAQADTEVDTESDRGIDFDGLADRVIALPVAQRNYDSLAVGKDGALYFIERVQPGITNEPPGQTPASETALKRFSFKDKKMTELAKGVLSFELAQDGKHMVLAKLGGRLFTATAGSKIKPKPLNTRDVKMRIDPRREWAQILHDVWRMEKEYFYTPTLHGLDWDGVYARYKALLPHVGRREDLNALIVAMIAEMEVGHNRAGGGDIHREDRVNVGLLGADIRAENGRYRISRIYDGENWNPFLTAPLAAPGIGVDEGDYILAVNGMELTAQDNFYAPFEDTVDEQVTLLVNDRPATDGAREVTVVPIGNEALLRLWDWIEANRRYVEEKTDGRVGYVYLPNTAGAGYTFFNRMFFAQADKPAVILDERANGGGQAANYITDVLGRSYLAGWKDHDDLVFHTPGGAIFGPKVMLIDQDAGSGGDFLPYSFRQMGLGPLIGTRTWGGLIGIAANPPLIDNGFLSVPNFRFFNPDGEWTIENEGVSPDIEVEQNPVAVNQGEDPQLDRAIAEILKRLENFKPIEAQQAPPVPEELGQ